MVCPLGNRLEEIRRRMFDAAGSGVTPVENYLPGRVLPLGRIEPSFPLPSLDEFLLPDRSRNNQLALAALAQIRPAVDCAIERFGADRLAVVIWPSASGIPEGGFALRQFAPARALPRHFA